MMYSTKIKGLGSKLGNIFLGLLVLSLSFFSLMPTNSVSAQEQICNEARLRNLQISVIDCSTDDDCSIPTARVGSGGVGSGDSIYILGDSITLGGASLYTSKYSDKQVTASINAFDGRSWISSGGGGGTPARDAVQQDRDKISSSKGIVVALGSNGGVSSNPIPEIIDSLRSINPNAPVWWVNTAGTSAYPLNLSYLGDFNRSLGENANTKNFRIIDWFKAVNPGGDPNISPTLDISGILSDGLHPDQNGYNTLTDLVVNTTTNYSASTTSNTDSSRNCICTTGSTNVNLIGSDNIEKVYRFFMGKGLSPEQAAGIAGNAMAESSGDPTIVSRSGSYLGLFQWDRTNRWARLVEWSNQNGKDPQTLEAQLEYSFVEAEQRGNIEGIKQYNTVELTTWYWGRFFEVAITGGSSTAPMTNVQHLDRRVNFAQEIFTKYGGLPGSGGSNGNCVPAGTTIGNFTVYSQTDPKWRDLPYGSSTIGVAGCGPAAMAMIITSLTGQSVTPVDTANYAANRGMYVPGTGSSWSIGPVVASNWGLRADAIGRDVGAITNALREGKLIITPGSGPKPFTSGGHFIVIRGVTESGNWLVGDSGHSDTSDKEWDPQQIVSSMRTGGSYAVYR